MSAARRTQTGDAARLGTGAMLTEFGEYGFMDERGVFQVRAATVTCPISTEGWTRRVHFVREGVGGGGGGGFQVRAATASRPVSTAHHPPPSLLFSLPFTLV